MNNGEKAKSCAAVSDEGGDEQVRNKAREAGEGRNREKPGETVLSFSDSSSGVAHLPNGTLQRQHTRNTAV